MAADTLRFSQLVKSSGRPHVATLWGEPKKDRSFAQAIRQNRILTVKQNPVGNKKDFGTNGFHEEKSVSYFVFPKPLPENKDARIVGIDYDVLEAGEPIGQVAKVPARKEPEKVIPPKFKRFEVVVKRTATIETTLEITAANASAAKESALKEIRGKSFSASEATVKNEVRLIGKSRTGKSGKLKL